MSYSRETMPEPSEQKDKPFIPLPNLSRPNGLNNWLTEHINRIPKGYEALTHPGGTSFTSQEQIDAYRKQIGDVALFRIGKKEPLEKV